LITEVGRHVEQPDEGFSFHGVVRTHRTDGAAITAPPAADQPRLDVTQGGLRIHMQLIGTLEHLEHFPVYRETHSDAPSEAAPSGNRYAVIVNAGTPYETAYLFRGDAGPGGNWALWALDAAMRRHVSYYVTFLPASFLTFNEALQEMVVRLGVAKALFDSDGFTAANVVQAQRLLDAIETNLGEQMGTTENASYLGESSGKRSAAAYHVAHSFIQDDEADKLGVPVGTYALVHLIENSGAQHATVVWWNRTLEAWTPAPFTADTQPDASDTAFPALRSLAENKPMPALELREALGYLAPRA
jgi:hypothetical protein